MIDTLLKRFGYTKAKPAKRSYAAATAGRLTAGWQAQNNTADVELHYQLRVIRARSRELVRNNDYAKKFIRMVKTNVIGPTGIILQNQAKDPNKTLDNYANDLIEAGWADFGKAKNCDVTGRYSFRELQILAIGAMAQDGEAIIRKVRGYPNKYGFALQLLESDHLDENYNDEAANISMGIEYDNYGKPIFYHLFKKHPGGRSPQGMEREKVPAADIIHLFLPSRISQGRGVPWMHTAMTRLKMLDGYEEAELVAARAGASKMGFYKSTNGEEYEGELDSSGNILQSAEPGHFEKLPMGLDFIPYDPQHPTSAYADFSKAILRGISSGFDVAYNTLANDLEGVNFSSMRAGALDEREVWKEIQQYVIDHMNQDIFEEWLKIALLTGAIPLPLSKFDKFNAASWQPRRWPWVDPVKDIQAAILAINAGLKTAQQVAAEQGLDIEDVYRQLAKEQDLRAKYNITTEFTLLQEEADAAANIQGA